MCSSRLQSSFRKSHKGVAFGTECVEAPSKGVLGETLSALGFKLGKSGFEHSRSIENYITDSVNSAPFEGVWEEGPLAPRFFLIPNFKKRKKERKKVSLNI